LVPDRPDDELAEFALPSRVASSWRRAMQHGVVPSTNLSELSVSSIDLESRLALAAGPVLDQVNQQLEGTTFSLVLADRAGVVIDRRWGEARIAHVLDEVGIVTGRRFAEDTSGPNGIGTVLELRQGVSVIGEEHYVEALKRFACYGHPIFNPVTRALEGVLDISCPVEHATPLLRPFVMSTVRGIEQRLAERACSSDMLVVESYRAAIRRRRRAPVLVLHDGAVVANASAVELLEAADQALFRDLAEHATHLAPQVHHLVLASGIEVEVRVHGIAQTTAALFEIDRRSSRSGARRPGRAERRHPGLPGELLDNRATRTPVLISGEPGSGRSTMARNLAGDQAVQALDSALIGEIGSEAWLARLADLSTHPGLLLIEDVHLLPDEAIRRVSALVQRGEVWVALTCAPIRSADGELAGLIARCVCRTETVPLRRRRNEFALVLRSLLARLGADPSVRFTPATIEVLAAHDWPGNLGELEAVLREVLVHRSCGDVLPADLPVAYRRGACTKRLNRVQQLEHDAIVTALRANRGNKVAAAHELGMSRSTFYRRIRTLRVPDDI
jgi:transcriptional regulator of acetoin/glycerol metabolism